jgi:hypothetical protein
MERIYKAYSTKIDKNYNWALSNPAEFAAQLNNEYWKLRNSKAKTWKRLNKLPVRIYGSGDYIPGHYNFLKDLNFKFFIISKTLTLKTMAFQIQALLELTNLTTIVLSFDADNIQNYDNVKHLFNTDRIKFAYTGMPDEFNTIKAQYSFNIFFNIGNKNVDKQKSRNHKEQCPCDSGLLAHNESCSYCNKCWRSSISKNL